MQARKASVKLVYELSAEEVEAENGNYLPEGTILEFCRSISSAGVGSYRLDGREVTYEVYESMLQKIGRELDSQNFNLVHKFLTSDNCCRCIGESPQFSGFSRRCGIRCF